MSEVDLLPTPVSDKPAYLLLTESGIKDALIEARGDIFVASQLLSVTALRINRAIQVSAVLQTTVDAIKDSSQGVSDDYLQKEIGRRLTLYRVVGLDALHDLAAMPINENSAQNQVKLAAAARLAGSHEAGGGVSEQDSILRALNEEYASQSKRIRVTRERVTVEMEGGKESPVTHQHTR